MPTLCPVSHPDSRSLQQSPVTLQHACGQSPERKVSLTEVNHVTRMTLQSQKPAMCLVSVSLLCLLSTNTLIPLRVPGQIPHKVFQLHPLRVSCVSLLPSKQTPRMRQPLKYAFVGSWPSHSLILKKGLAQEMEIKPQVA